MRIATFVYNGKRQVGQVSADGLQVTPFALSESQAHLGAQPIIEALVAGQPLPALAGAALAVVISGWLLALMYQHRHEKMLPAAFALIIGGALGNVYDRLVHGAVVDFLHFHYAGWSWPAFNLADSAITVGVVMMLWGQLFPRGDHTTHDQTRPGAHS